MESNVMKNRATEAPVIDDTVTNGTVMESTVMESTILESTVTEDRVEQNDPTPRSDSRWMRLATSGLLVASLTVPAIGLAAQPADASDPFDALMSARGEAYVSLRDELVGDGGIAEELLEQHREGTKWAERLQAEILLAWRRDAAGMRQVCDAIEDWQAMPTATLETGEAVVAAPFEPFVGQERLLTLSLIEILMHRRDGFQFSIPEQLDLVFLFLGDVRAREATPLLLAIATEAGEPDRVRLSALDALRSTGDPAAADRLMGLATDDPSAAIRRAAVAVLGDIEDRDLIPFLERVADDDADPTVREEARAMIEYLDAYFDDAPWPEEPDPAGG